MELYCGTCNEKLTRIAITETEHDSLAHVDGEEAVPEFKFVLSENFDFVFPIKVTHVVSTNCLRLVNHTDAKLLHGCCGPSTMEKYNQVCPKCSEPIGVIFADCWAPHFTAFNADKLVTRPKW